MFASIVNLSQHTFHSILECDSWESVHHSPHTVQSRVFYKSQRNTHQPRHMRKIEQQMNDAITNGINWQSANTAVTFDPETETSTVYLHGNKIAEVGDFGVRLWDGDHQSATTKSRLNAILSEHAISGECVFQKDFAWYVRKFVGCINGKNILR